MALNTNYQLTDGSNRTKQKNNTAQAVEKGANAVGAIANTGAAINYGKDVVKAIGDSVQTNVQGASTNRGGSSGGSGGGGAAAAGVNYQQSGAVSAAYDKLQSLQAPVYNNPYEAKLNSIYEQILNRPDFKYNVNEDALYKQYKDMYMQNGKTAMQDTIAQASALTGGYDNSYAQTAGQQAYQGYLSELNNMVPTLANQAYSRYMDEGNELRENFDMTKGRYDDVYNQYRDAMSDYLTERNYLTNRYEDERDYWLKYLSGLV